MKGRLSTDSGKYGWAKSRPRAAGIVSALVSSALTASLISCDGSGSDRPNASPGREDSSDPRSHAGKQPASVEIPRLTKNQEEEALKILKRDPVFREISAGQNPTIVSVGGWTRTGEELLGAAVGVSCNPSVSYDGSDWPSIVNKEELYGENFDEEGDPGPVEPNVEPEVELSDVSESDLKRLTFFVYLKGDRVADILRT